MRKHEAEPAHEHEIEIGIESEFELDVRAEQLEIRLQELQAETQRPFGVLEQGQREIIVYQHRVERDMA